MLRTAFFWALVNMFILDTSSFAFIEGSMWSVFFNSRRALIYLHLYIAMLTLFGCARGPSRLYQPEGYGAPPGSHRLVEVMDLAQKSQVQQLRGIYEPLAAAGIKDAASRERSIGAGRVYCCGGLLDEAHMNYFYIPLGIQVEPGDIVEIKCGSAPQGGKPSVNTVVRVVQLKNDATGTCRWVPPDQRRGRILYCDWMPQQGWVKHKGSLFVETWIKPAPH